MAKRSPASRPRKVHLWSSLQTKFVLTYVMLIAAVLVLLNIYSPMESRNLIIRSKQAALQNQTAVMSASLSGLEMLSREGIEKVFGEILLENQDLNHARVMVTDSTGLILYDTAEEETNAEGQYALFGEVVQALEGKGYDVFRCEYRSGSFRSYSAAPVLYRGMTIGAVYYCEYDDEQGALLIGIQMNLRNISAIICIVALLFSMLFSRTLTRRLAALMKAIRIVREGEYSHRVLLGGQDELALLADEFDELTGRIQTTEEMRRRFVSDASHELKTPLASICLLTDSILQTENMDPDTVREFVADIGEEAERLTRITEKLLILTRMDNAPAVETEPVDVGYMVEKVEHMLQPLARAVNIELRCTLPEGCLVQATQDDLYQIIFNLMENAIKYNLPGGSVTATLEQDEKNVYLRIEDTGVGIPEEDLPKIFDRFYRVDKARSRAAGGTGLGLSIVRDTARQHGGTVTARPRAEGQGTCFEVTFPRCRMKGEYGT